MEKVGVVRRRPGLSWLTDGETKRSECLRVKETEVWVSQMWAGGAAEGKGGWDAGFVSIAGLQIRMRGSGLGLGLGGVHLGISKVVRLSGLKTFYSTRTRARVLGRGPSWEALWWCQIE